MKFLVTLLAVYTTVLLVIPCPEARNTHLIHSMASTHQHQSSDADLCSPFCTCACCPAPAISMQEVFIEEYIPFIKTIESIYKPNSVSPVYISFRQPPKIA